MSRLNEVLSVLRAHQGELRARGVLHAGVFGSVARGEETARSDVDIALDLDPLKQLGLFEVSGINLYLRDLFGCGVDTITRPCRNATVREAVERDYKNAF